MSTHLGAAAPEQGRTLARRAEAGGRARDSFREGGRAQGVVCDVTKKIGCDAVAAAALCCARTAAAVSLHSPVATMTRPHLRRLALCALAVATASSLATRAAQPQGTTDTEALAIPNPSRLKGNDWRGRMSPLAASSFVGLPFTLTNSQGQR